MLIRIEHLAPNISRTFQRTFCDCVQCKPTPESPNGIVPDDQLPDLHIQTTGALLEWLDRVQHLTHPLLHQGGAPPESCTTLCGSTGSSKPTTQILQEHITFRSYAQYRVNISVRLLWNLSKLDYLKTCVHNNHFKFRHCKSLMNLIQTQIMQLKLCMFHVICSPSSV